MEIRGSRRSACVRPDILRRWLFPGLLLFLSPVAVDVAAGVAAADDLPPPKPNLVFLLVDDLGWTDAGPAIDLLTALLEDRSPLVQEAARNGLIRLSSEQEREPFLLEAA